MRKTPIDLNDEETYEEIQETLDTLAEDGLVEIHVDESGNKKYRLTPGGVQEIQSMIDKRRLH